MKCPHCREEIEVASNLYGRGDERRPTPQELKRQQSRDRYEDVNQSTRPGEVNLADLKKGRS